MVNVGFDKYSYVIDGKRELLRIAAVHYFRLPGEQLWRDRLSKLKYAGYNTLDMYFYWGYHSEEEGKYNFEGLKDIRKLLSIAEEYGFYVIARPGPYVNAELTSGGFPGWLVAKKDLILRNRKENDYVCSEGYMNYVKDWYQTIIPIVNEFSNIVSVQIENEYSTNECEPDYLEELKKIVRDCGCMLPLTHNDMYVAGLYADIVDVYAVDNYSVTYFEEPWQSFPEVFAVLDELEETIRSYDVQSPLYIAELQAGWFDKWGGMGYDAMRESLGRQHIDIVTKTSLAQGVTAFTHYMACGGTNWNNMGSTEVYTSYDFAALISEEGVPTDRFFAARQINMFLSSFDMAQTKIAEKQPDIKPVNPSTTIYCKVRENLKDKSRWLFLRNDSLGEATVIVNEENKVDIHPQEMVILPSNLQLNSVKVKYSTLPFLARIQDEKSEAIVVKTSLTGIINLDIDESAEIEFLGNKKVIDYSLGKTTMIINYKKLGSLKEPEILKIKQNGTITSFIFLPEKQMDYLCVIDNRFVIGADYVTALNDFVKLATNTFHKVITIDSIANIQEIEISEPKKIVKIDLESFETYNLSDEIEKPEDIAGWQKVSEYLDADYNGLYEGYFYYKTTYEGKLDSITINARHCFALYLNGKEVLAHDSFNSISGLDTEKPVTVDLKKEDQQESNTFVLLIRSMGHNKGFEDDSANPRGLLGYETTPQKALEWSIKEGPSTNTIKDGNLSIASTGSQKNYVECLVTKFNFSMPENHQAPIGLVFNKPPFNKADIYLNDVLIGHYWRDKGPQEKYYLPETFYHQDGTTNTIKLVVWYRSIDNNKNYPTKLNNDTIFIEPYVVYKLTDLKELP